MLHSFVLACRSFYISAIVCSLNPVLFMQFYRAVTGPPLSLLLSAHTHRRHLYVSAN